MTMRPMRFAKTEEPVHAGRTGFRYPPLSGCRVNSEFTIRAAIWPGLAIVAGIDVLARRSRKLIGEFIFSTSTFCLFSH